MWDARFFQTTRGKVLLLLKKRGSCTVAYLSQQLELTPNAIRQHLSALERDSLVTQQPVKTGPNRPALVFSLTAHAESFFPKRYDTLLSGLVQELVRQQGTSEVRDLLAQLGESAASNYADQLARLTFEEKVKAVGRIMEESGSILEWVRTEEALAVRDFNCPYAAVARGHQEVCEVQRSFLQRLFHPAEVAIACDQQQARCQFQINTNAIR